MQTLLQLHATRDELVDLAASWQAESQLYITAIGEGRECPVKFRSAADGVKPTGDAAEDARWLVLTPKKPNTTNVTQLFDFAGQNDNYVAFTLPSGTKGALEQSSGEFNATDPQVERLWKKLLARLRKSLHAGMWVVNPDRKIKEFYKGMAYTDGALTFFCGGGVLLVSASGRNQVFPGLHASHPLLDSALEHRRS